MTSLRRDAIRHQFWAPPAGGIAAGLVLGFLLVEVDYRLDIDPGVFTFIDLQSARAVLQTIATVTVSVAGLAFSVTVVALQLASQQLSPRVLRTFQGDRLSQMVLAVFVGTFVFALVVLAKLTEQGVPALSLTVAILAAVAAFGLFAAFIHHIIVSLKASTILKRISRDGRHAVERRWPSGEGRDAGREAQDSVRRQMRAPAATAVRSARAGFVTGVDAAGVIRTAAEHGLLVRQRAGLGEFALSGGILADVWATGPVPDPVVSEIREGFRLEDERRVVDDVGYPIRQLVDVALRALSPSLNDPTTAENALLSMADLLVLLTTVPAPELVRADEEGNARLVATAPDFDDLVREGFDQVRVSVASQPTLRRRLVRLIEDIEEHARAHGIHSEELRRQAELMDGG